MGGEYSADSNPAYSNKVYEYMTESNTLFEVQPMQTPRSCFAFFYNYPERYVYVVGGEY